MRFLVYTGLRTQGRRFRTSTASLSYPELSLDSSFGCYKERDRNVLGFCRQSKANLAFPVPSLSLT
jgi:hypothetical protein